MLTIAPTIQLHGSVGAEQIAHADLLNSEALHFDLSQARSISPAAIQALFERARSMSIGLTLPPAPATPIEEAPMRAHAVNMMLYLTGATNFLRATAHPDQFELCP